MDYIIKERHSVSSFMKLLYENVSRNEPALYSLAFKRFIVASLLRKRPMSLVNYRHC